MIKQVRFSSGVKFFEKDSKKIWQFVIKIIFINFAVEVQTT
jgi:hypothetical protein